MTAALMSCWVAALNGRHTRSLARVYADSVEYFWDSRSADSLITAQLEELRRAPASYALQATDVRVDQFGQARAVVTLVSSAGETRALLAGIYKIKGRLRIGTLNSQEEAELNDKCNDAVNFALASIPDIQKWERGLARGLPAGGLFSPLRDGELEMTLGGSFPDRLEVVYTAHVKAGHLRVTELAMWDLRVPPIADERVRKACIPFKEDCAAACSALGQRLHKGKILRRR